MADSEGIATRASKRRRISAPVNKPLKTRSRVRSGSPDELAAEAKPLPIQRVVSVSISTLPNVTEEVPRQQASSPLPIAPSIRIAPEEPALLEHFSPAAPSSYSPVTQYDEDEEEEVDIVRSAEETNDTTKDHRSSPEPTAEDHQDQPSDPMATEDEDEDEAAAVNYRYPESFDQTPTDNKIHTSVGDDRDNSEHRKYGNSFRAQARSSRDIQPSRSPSAPAYSRISTPIATPEPTPAREAVYVPYKSKTVLKGHKRGVAVVRVSPNGRMIASCSADATIRVWDSATGKHINTFEGHLAGISTLAWAPDSKTIASGSDDKSIRLWDVPTGKAHPHPLVGHHNYIYSIAFSPKGNILVSGSYDEAVFLWDIRTRRILRSLPAHSDPVGGVDFIRDGTLIVSCAGDGLIRIWDTGTGQCLRTLVHEDNAAVTSVRFSPNGKFVLAWTLDACVRLWDYVEGRCVKTYQGHQNGKFSMSGAYGVYGGWREGVEEEEKAYVVSGSENGDVLVWDVVSKAVLQRIEGAHEGVVLGVDTWRDLQGRGWMVSCGVDKTVRIWERAQDVDGAGAQREEESALGERSEMAMGETLAPSDKMEGVERSGEVDDGLLHVPVKMEEHHSSRMI